MSAVARAAAALALCATTLVAAPETRAADCALGGCIDASRLPPAPTADMADIVARAQAFFGVDTKVYIVSSAAAGAVLPYYQPALPPIVAEGQIQIPEIYHAVREAAAGGRPHYVWHYIIGHEMAHAYQDATGLIAAMRAPVDSVILAELHADYLAGYFMAAEFGLSSGAIDQLLRELKVLPSGRPGEPSYHGSVTQRFVAATQGALLALARPRPDLAEASRRGALCVFELAGVAESAGALCQAQ